MNTAPKMKTTPSLTPEQIRAIVGQHHAIVKRRRYIRTRTIVRVAFWTTLTLAIVFTLAHFGLLPDDYRDTCEALGQTCPK